MECPPNRKVGEIARQVFEIDLVEFLILADTVSLDGEEVSDSEKGSRDGLSVLPYGLRGLSANHMQ
jgi:hypothetical protein